MAMIVHEVQNHMASHFVVDRLLILLLIKRLCSTLCVLQDKPDSADAI